MSAGLWIGPARGPVVVALHDDGGAPADWEAMARGLGRIGYRVLALPRAGGVAEGVAGVEAALRAEGLLDEAPGLGALDPGLTLLGHGAGGAVATAFAAERPERVRRLILLATAGIAALREAPPPPPRASPLARLPLIGRLFAPPPATPPPTEEALPQEAEHRRIGREDVPVFAIWGEADAEVPLRALGRLAAWNRAARQEVIAGANHDLPRSQADHVVAILRAEFREEA